MMTRSLTLTTLATTNMSTVAAVAPPPEAVTVELDFVVILATLICMVGLIAVAHCGSRSTATSSPTQALANKGLKKKVLQSLPKFTYDLSDSYNAKNLKLATAECAICLGEFVDRDKLRVLPQCGHAFQVPYINTWFKSHSSCLSCRQILQVATC
jgi:hypothetical protein